MYAIIWFNMTGTAVLYMLIGWKKEYQPFVWKGMYCMERSPARKADSIFTNFPSS